MSDEVRCPDCGSRHVLVEATCVVRLSPAGEVYTAGEPHTDENSNTLCDHCERSGPLKDFSRNPLGYRWGPGVDF